MQYGTVARMKAKKGMLEELRKMTEAEDMTDMAGHVATLVYQMDSDPDELYMAVVFESQEAYKKNADSPDQDARYREFIKLLDGEPEWHDGTIIYNHSK
jgi:quinol monooxygenase YgiN